MTELDYENGAAEVLDIEAAKTFKSVVKSNKSAFNSRCKFCEENAKTYRTLLTKDDMTFDEKREVHGWIMDEHDVMEDADVARIASNADVLDHALAAFLMGLFGFAGFAALVKSGAIGKVAKSAQLFAKQARTICARV